MAIYKYIFATHDSDYSSPINGVYEVPMKGYESEEKAFEALTALPMYETIDGADYWKGSLIGIQMETVTISD
jgi:hypothetical protein